MAKWASDKKKAKQETVQAPVQEEPKGKYGVLIDGNEWLHRRLGRGHWIAGPRKGAWTADTLDEADEMALSLSIESYVDRSIKAWYFGPTAE